MNRIVLYFVFPVLFLLFLQCSPTDLPRKGGEHTAGEVADTVRAGGNTKSTCTGEECCSAHKDCKRTCDQIFYKSDSHVRKVCKSLPEELVIDLKELVSVLRVPLFETLDALSLTEEFRLLLALDYEVLVRIIKAYNINSARSLLIWLADNHDSTEELLLLKDTERYEIMYELLASAGDREHSGAVEKGLAKNISVEHSFFHLVVSNNNYDMLQITHEMIREDLCAPRYSGTSQKELCILRIYCKEKKNRPDEYVHSEDLRNEMARNIKDEEFLHYIERNILHTGLRVRMSEPIMNNGVCRFVCRDKNRSCE